MGVSGQDNYRIEVSGWGLNDVFFVEKTDLHWTEDGEKRLLLHRSLPDGTVIFVRLISPQVSFSSVPVAYQVQGVEPMNPAGLCAMRLLQLHPRSKPQAFASLEAYSPSNTCEPKESCYEPDLEEVLHEA